MNLTDKYISALQSEQQELNAYVKQKIASISKPTIHVIPVTTQPICNNNSSSCIGYTVVGAVVGAGIGVAASENKFVGILIGAIVGAIAGYGTASLTKGSTNSAPEAPQPQVEYYQWTSHYYNALSDINKQVSSKWTNKLQQLKAELKADIAQLNISEDKKNAAIQSVLTTSVIDLSMSDLRQALAKIEQSKNESGYEQYKTTFEKQCIAAINNAFNEQKAIYEKLNTII